MFGLGRDAQRAENEATAEVAREQGFGGQSMVAPLRRVIVQQPAPPGSAEDWRTYGYTREVDHGRTQDEFNALCVILEGEGIDVIRQEPDEAGRLDSIFVYDTSIVTDEGVVLVNHGKEIRRVEVDYARSLYQDLDVPIIGQIMGDGMLEGGDVFWLERDILAAGVGYRTNTTGIDQLATFVRPGGIDVIPVDLPHWRGPDECLHLLSLISPVAERTAVVYAPLISTSFMKLLQALEWTLIEIPDEEFSSQATNVLALAPNRVLMLPENTRTIKRLESAGVEVLTYEGAELSHNRQGGPTCLTRPLLRDTSTT